MSAILSPKGALVLLLVALVAITAGSIVTAELADGEQPDFEAEYVELEDGTMLWPYHGHSPDHTTRTLPINVIVYGDAAATEHLLMEGTVGEWEELPEEQRDVDPEETADAADAVQMTWGAAEGSIRYVHLDPVGEVPAHWTYADYQLHDGDYFGSRHHIRAYVDPSEGSWTAMQAHREHWDWFRLRHTVHSVEDSQRHVEVQLLDHPAVSDVHRTHFDNDQGSDADGWVTVVDLEHWLSAFVGVLLAGSLATRGRQSLPEPTDPVVRAGLLAGAVITPYLFVRFGAIVVERTVPVPDPRLIVVLFLPILVVGVPVATYLAARPLNESPAFAVASVAFLVALFLDYTILGVTALRLDTILYHVAVAAAVGFIAAGASRRARRPDTSRGHVRTGVLLWIVVGVLPLLRFVHPV